VSLACDKAKDHGYPHELWTTRLLARHVREHAPAAGHACLANLAQGTVCKILGHEEVKPYKVRYYLERRDPEFEPKMAEVLCVYRQAQVLKKAAARRQKPGKPVAIVSYDEGLASEVTKSRRCLTSCLRAACRVWACSSAIIDSLPLPDSIIQKVLLQHPDATRLLLGSPCSYSAPADQTVRA
jgi:hypothetical protein